MSRIRRIALTTEDNGFDPFKQPVDWFRRDCELGYNTECVVARMLTQTPWKIDGKFVEYSSENMTYEEEMYLREKAYDLLMFMHPDLYKKVQIFEEYDDIVVDVPEN